MNDRSTTPESSPRPVSVEESEAEKTMMYALRHMSWRQWLVFFATYLGWSLTMFNVSLIPLTISQIAKEFNVPTSSALIAITCMMITRSLGCLFWGWASDAYGRKRPFLLVILCLVASSFATGLSSNLPAFVISRAVLGFAMGGEWGLGAALCMETIPTETRGFFSGALQSGTYLGFLLASAAFRYTSAYPSYYTWHSLCYFSLIPGAIVLLLCLCIPESPVWLETQRRRKEALSRAKMSSSDERKSHTSQIMEKYFNSFWITRVLYLIILNTAKAYVFHAAYDLFPTILMVQRGMSPDATSIVMMIQSISALCGGPIVGFIGQAFLSRKATMVICYILLAGAVYPYYMCSDRTLLTIGAAAVHFLIAGGLSPIPAYLSELSPPELRGTVPGVAYNFGQSLSAPLPQLIALVAEKRPKIQDNGKDIPDFSIVAFVIMVISIAATLFMVFIGPENKGGDLVSGSGAHDRAENDDFDIEDDISEVFIMTKESATKSFKDDFLRENIK